MGRDITLVGTEQLDTGGDLQGTNDLIFIRRETSPGNFENFKVTAEAFSRGVLGATYDRASVTGNNLSLGEYFVYGAYTAAAADVNLTQASPTTTLGTANEIGKGRIFIVAAAVGTSDGTVGAVEIEISGTSVSDDGVKVDADTEVLVADTTDATVITNAFFQTSKSWVGQVTVTLQVNGSSDAVNFALDFNLGVAQFQSGDDNVFTLSELSFEGLAAVNDPVFEVELFKHSSSGWTYSAAAFIPGSNPIARLTTTNGTNVQLIAGNYFKFKLNLNQEIQGNQGEGYLLKITTSVNNSIEYINTKIGII